MTYRGTQTCTFGPFLVVRELDDKIFVKKQRRGEPFRHQQIVTVPPIGKEAAVNPYILSQIRLAVRNLQRWIEGEEEYRPLAETNVQSHRASLRSLVESLKIRHYLASPSEMKYLKHRLDHMFILLINGVIEFAFVLFVIVEFWVIAHPVVLF